MSNLDVRASQVSGRKCCKATVLFLATAFCHAPTSAAPVQTLALSGQQAAGMPAGVNYHRVGLPRINDQGQIAFAALLNAEFTSNGIWSNRSGAIAPIVLPGDVAPGTAGGFVFDNLQLSGFNESGQIAITAALKGLGGQASGEGVWSEKDGNLRIVARSGQLAPGAPNSELFHLLGAVSLNDEGHTAFLATTSGGKFGVWLDGSQGLQLAGLTGQPAPGIPGEVFRNPGSPLIGSRNQVAFESGTGSFGLLRMWAGTPGQLTFLGVPVTTDGRSYYFDESGKLGVATYRDGRHASDAKFGSPDHLEVVASTGDQLVGRNGQLLEISTVSLPFFDRDGVLSMKLATNPVGESSETWGLWRKLPGGWDPIVRIGDQAPGAAEGIVFTSFDWQVFNELGQVAFAARLSGGTGYDNGIWATDLSGRLQLIAKTGDFLEVAPGDIRTVRDLYVAGNAFNDQGQLVFQANMEGGWGAFLSQAVAVPEPSAATLMAMGFVGLLGRLERRKRRTNLDVVSDAVPHRA